jgi:hypothetical protein
VHINRSITASDAEIVSNNKEAFLPAFQKALDENPDLAYARILCPRQLETNVAYHAFLVPSFETGRQAGLGVPLDPNIGANQPAWEEETPEGLELPYYHRWYFRTGTVGDFEYLVRLLEVKPVDKSVGVRDMDLTYPGSNLPGLDDPALGGILKLGGALRPPRKLLEEILSKEELEEYNRYEEWYKPYPHPFQKALASFINLSSDYSKQSALEANQNSKLGSKENDPENDPKHDPDPMITPPLYGRWHALTDRLLTQENGIDIPNNFNWLHQLNLDPRFRVAAGFGTQVIQKKQEEYMNAAWEQLGDVIEANRRMRQAQLSKEIVWIWYERHLKRLNDLSPEKALVFTTPMQRRVVTDGSTVHQHFRESVIPPSLTSTAMRRVLRPGGRLMRSTKAKVQSTPSDPFRGNILSRINQGELKATLPKLTPLGLPTLEKVSDNLTKTVSSGSFSFLADVLRRFPWLVFVPLGLIVIVALLTLIFSFTVVVVPVGLAIIAGLYKVFQYLSRVQQKWNAIDSIRPDKQTPDSVDRLVRSPDFRLVNYGDQFQPKIGGSDSAVASRFKSSLKDVNLILNKSIEIGLEPHLKSLDLSHMSSVVQEAINPESTIPIRILHSIRLPKRIAENQNGPFQEAWAYPEFDTPMYKPLIEISSDLFLPNIQRIEMNSITLLETNQKFIEAYMVGLNHEFARELLWREYLTDQRGSYFRQFWDVSSFLNTDPQQNPNDVRENLRDIPPIHRWSAASQLGEHDQRQQTRKGKEEVVLVIRGELLKKYPTAVIYAHRAKWHTDDSGSVDKSKARLLDPPYEELGENPSRDKIRTPLYEAKIEPDIYFFGFDLTAEDIIGESGDHPDDPGWFFIVKERPGEPRFGLDVDQQTEINVWNDFSWKDVLPPGTEDHFLKFDSSFLLVEPDANSPKRDQYKEDSSGGDEKVSWDANTNSAEAAYILFQTPVLIAIHGAELLKKV